MKLSGGKNSKIRQAGQIILVGILIALLYPLFADGFSDPPVYIHTFFIGLIGGFLVSIIEIWWFEKYKKRFTFFAQLVVKSALYFSLFAMIIPTAKTISESLFFGMSIHEYIIGDRFQEFLTNEYHIVLVYALVFIPVIVFTKQMSRKLGQGVLLSFITGHYHVPKEVSRIFMFLDISQSTTIAENLGSIKYHQFLNEFYQDISSCIVEHHGKIYRYVGDQIVVYWKMPTGLEKANCIRTHFSAKVKINHLQKKYRSIYGFEPSFTSCFHCGNLIVGEIGYVKSQIVYHGETLYELHAIEKLCSKYSYELLVSEALINELKLSEVFLPEIIPESEEVNMNVYKLQGSL